MFFLERASSSSSHEWRRRALNTGVTFFSGVEADRKKKKKGKTREKCGCGGGSRKEDRRVLKFRKRNSSRFLLLVAVSTRVVSSLPHPPVRAYHHPPPSFPSPFHRISQTRSRFGKKTNHPAFSPFLSFEYPSPRRGGWRPTANRSGPDSSRSGLICSTLRRISRLEIFQAQKNSQPRFISLSWARVIRRGGKFIPSTKSWCFLSRPPSRPSFF